MMPERRTKKERTGGFEGSNSAFFSFVSVEKVKRQNINSEVSRLLLLSKCSAVVFKPVMSHCVSHCHSLLSMAKWYISNS